MIPGVGTIAAYTCKRPFYEVLSDAISNGKAPLDWVMCPYTITGIGLQGFGFFLILTVAAGMLNWSESFRLPAVWIVLSAGVLVAMVPAPLVDRIFGFIVAAIFLFFLGVIYYFR